MSFIIAPVETPDVLAQMLENEGLRSEISPDIDDIPGLAVAALERFCVLAAVMDRSPVGFFAVEARTPTWYDFHGAMLPGYRGAFAMDFMRDCIQSVFEESDADVITTHTPECNRAAQHLNVAAGLGRMGRIPRGEWGHDLIIYGITRGVFDGT